MTIMPAPCDAQVSLPAAPSMPQSQPPADQQQYQPPQQQQPQQQQPGFTQYAQAPPPPMAPPAPQGRCRELMSTTATALVRSVTGDHCCF